jgi:hypothetical protein
MACDASHGRVEGCKDSNGGLDAIYFINNVLKSTDLTYGTSENSDTLTAVTNAVTLYKYELKGDNAFDEDIVSSRENGTTMVNQKLTMKLKKQDIQTTKQVKLLCMGRPHVVVRTRNNVYKIMGLEYGTEINANLKGGTKLGDYNGYELNLIGEEKIPANILNASTEASMLALFTSATLVTS